MIKLNEWAKKQIHNGIRKHANKIRTILQADKPLEAVSINLIQGLLVDAFGYKEEELLPNENISNKHVDIAIHHPAGGIMCEGKRYNPKASLLNADAQRQLDLYCHASVCEWGILTDGIRWEFYWYPFGKTKKDRQKIAEVDFIDLPTKISRQYCEKFSIFHSKLDVKNRREYAKAQDAISAENVRWYLRHEEVFKALRQVIQDKQNKTLAEVNRLVPHIYACFKEVLPLPEGRNNPYDPTKKKIKQKKTNNGVVSLVVEHEIGKE